MKRQLAFLALAALLGGAPRAAAFCGFYVAKADAKLWNEASQVVLVRDGERTVLTMSNDFSGDLKEFALVVPVPVLLEKEQIHVGERKWLEHLDAFSAPRLVEYFDEDPCQAMVQMMTADSGVSEGAMVPGSMQERAKANGVTIEAQYTVGEYDILILSAKESGGLETWLRDSGYKLPEGAAKALAPYISQQFRFFVAKVNLKEQAKTGFSYLRPLQMAFESKRFMLPIRLGMLNAKGTQDLIVYALTRQGRVETANYRAVKIPSDAEVPLYVKEEFASFYKDMFRTSWEREGKNVSFLEYFWDMSWCDPCAADPLSPDELRGLGVFWLDEATGAGAVPPGAAQASNVLLTRLHIRYDGAHFPEDLSFQETRDRGNFQGRYILHHPFTGAMSCPEGKAYVRSLSERREQEAKTLAHLTGWPIERIRQRIAKDPLPRVEPAPAPTPAPTPTPLPWWKRVWK